MEQPDTIPSPLNGSQERRQARAPASSIPPKGDLAVDAERPGRGPDRQKRDALIHAIAILGLMPSDAASASGYSFSRVRELLREPAFQAEIRAHVLATVGACAPVALRALTEIVSNPLTEDLVRLNAAKTLLDRAGYPALTVDAARDRGRKSLSDYSLTELEAIVAAGQIALNQKQHTDSIVSTQDPSARPVVSAPTPADTDTP